MLSLLSCLTIAALSADPETTTAQKSAIADALAPSLVKVEFELRYDKGQPPQASGYAERCPNCGQFHSTDVMELIADERPLESGGFLIAEQRVLVPDPMIHPRFVKSVRVRFRDRVADASIAGYADRQSGLLLDVAKPLAGSKPLSFASGQGNGYLAVSYGPSNGTWAITIQGAGKHTTVTETGRKFIALESNALILDTEGTPVAITMTGEGPTDLSWKTSPTTWPTTDAATMEKRLRDLEVACDRGLPHVTLGFRSPKTNAENRYSYRRYGNDLDEDATSLDVLGVLLDEKRLLVLANLPARTTARLERITVQPAAGEPVTATFNRTLTDYGCLLATLDKPLKGAVTVSSKPLRSLLHQLLLSAEVSMKGQQRTAYYLHARLSGFQSGFRNAIYPESTSLSDEMFIFDDEGGLVSLPVQRRKKVTVRDEWSYDEMLATPVAYLLEALKDLDANSDPNNVPLTEEEENRLAWMGVELQPLDAELARLNNVSDMTNDGESGALVTYIYPESPAAKAGVQTGDVLLRLHVEGQPRPLEVNMQDDSYFSMNDFPWDELESGQYPPEIFERLPQPWASVENTFTRSLTDLGFQTPYTADLWRDGKLLNIALEVVPGPSHYNSAAKYKSEPLGLTVRDLTYEVRRYFQKPDDEPGVIVSKVEAGSKTAVAGMMPYEIVTHVNDEPVKSVADFERLTSAGGDLRLEVKRRTRGRLVKLNVDTATKPAGTANTEPGEGE